MTKAAPKHLLHTLLLSRASAWSIAECMKKQNLLGKTFGRWVVEKELPQTNKVTFWLCRCRCGTVRPVRAQALSVGTSTSCGCFREENRPNLARNRNFSGGNNPRAKKSTGRNGGVWVPSTSVFYKRAAGVFYSAKKRGVPLGFSSVGELATYVESITPDVCPVFGTSFSSRGRGFCVSSPSLDKIDPKLGYVRGNIQVISMLANCMKRDASPQQLRQFASWVLKGDKCT
jgi:hypothetical protein